MAATTGSDADWVVKLIDVYPDEVAGEPEMGGYQLPVSMDILSRAVSGEFLGGEGDCSEYAADVQVCAADDESCVSAGAPDYGAGAVELVSAV